MLNRKSREAEMEFCVLYKVQEMAQSKFEGDGVTRFGGKICSVDIFLFIYEFIGLLVKNYSLGSFLHCI